MTLSKSCNLTVGNTDRSIFYKNRPALYNICATTGTSAAIAIIEAEGFCECVVFFNLIVPGANDAFGEIFAASYQIKLQLSFTSIIGYEMNNTGEFNFDLRFAQAGCIKCYICNCFRGADTACVFLGTAAISSKSESTAVTAFEYYWLWKRMPGVIALCAIVVTVTVAIVIIFLILVEFLHFITSNGLS